MCHKLGRLVLISVSFMLNAISETVPPTTSSSSHSLRHHLHKSESSIASTERLINSASSSESNQPLPSSIIPCVRIASDACTQQSSLHRAPLMMRLRGGSMILNELELPIGGRYEGWDDDDILPTDNEMEQLDQMDELDSDDFHKIRMDAFQMLNEALKKKDRRTISAIASGQQTLFSLRDKHPVLADWEDRIEEDNRKTYLKERKERREDKDRMWRARLEIGTAKRDLENQERRAGSKKIVKKQMKKITADKLARRIARREERKKAGKRLRVPLPKSARDDNDPW